MKGLKKLTAIILCVAMMFSTAVIAFAAEERNIVDSGFCGAQGDNLTWTLYADGELVISGEGKMDWYYVNLNGEDDFLEVLPPWYGYYNQIKVITLEEGVTSIGNHAFAGENLGYHRVNIPLSLKVYDGYPLDCADNSCDSGKTCNVYYPGDKFDWGNNISRLEPKFIPKAVSTKPSPTMRITYFSRSWRKKWPNGTWTILRSPKITTTN